MVNDWVQGWIQWRLGQMHVCALAPVRALFTGHSSVGGGKGGKKAARWGELK